MKRLGRLYNRYDLWTPYCRLRPQLTFDRPMPTCDSQSTAETKPTRTTDECRLQVIVSGGTAIWICRAPSKIGRSHCEFSYGLLPRKGPSNGAGPALLKRPPFCPCITPRSRGANFIWVRDWGQIALYFLLFDSVSRGVAKCGNAPALPGGPSDPSCSEYLS